MPVFATVHLLISVPKGQHYFRIYFFYFHQNLEGHLWKINPCIFIFSYQCDLGDSTVNERDKKDMIWETLRLQIRKKKVLFLVCYPTINFMKWYSDDSLQTMHENTQWSLTGLQRACWAKMISITKKSISCKWWRSKDFRPALDMIL